MPTEEKDTQTWLREVEEREGKATKGSQYLLHVINAREELVEQDIPKFLALVRKQEAIIKEAKAALEEIARRYCLGELLGEGTGDGCARCQARVTLARMQEIEKGEKP